MSSEDLKPIWARVTKSSLCENVWPRVWPLEEGVPFWFGWRRCLFPSLWTWRGGSVQKGVLFLIHSAALSGDHPGLKAHFLGPQGQSSSAKALGGLPLVRWPLGEKPAVSQSFYFCPLTALGACKPELAHALELGRCSGYRSWGPLSRWGHGQQWKEAAACGHSAWNVFVWDRNIALWTGGRKKVPEMFAPLAMLPSILNMK